MAKELILIVDDEKAICDILSQMLAKSSYTTMCFYDFKSAKDYYKKNYGDIDLVLMDLQLPDIKGEDAIIELLQINPNVKVIILSGYVISSGQDGSILGAKRLVQKPVKMTELEQVVREVLDE